MKKILSILLFLISLPVLSQTNYYVSTSGDNGDNGLTELTPWETLAYAESHATTAGDSIWLKRGDTFVCDDVFEINGGGSAGTYIVWDGDKWGTGAKAVIQSGAQVHYNALFRIAACDYLVIQNITFDVNNHNVYGIVIGSDYESFGPTQQNDERFITIRGCKVYDVGNATQYLIGILVQPQDNDMYDIRLEYDTVDYAASHGIAMYAGRFTPDRYILHNGYIGYCHVEDAGQYGAGAANGIFLNNGIDSCIVERNSVLQGTGNCPGIAIAHSEDDPTDQPHKIYIRYNNVRMDDQEAFAVYYGGNKTIYTYYNLFYSVGSVDKHTISVGYSTYTGATLTFYNNVIINTSTSTNSACFYNGATNTGVVTFRNNILYSNKAADDLPMFKNEAAGNTIHSYNLYHSTRAGSGVYFVQNCCSNYYTRATITTWEATAQEGDPLFDEDVADFDTLWVGALSEAIDNGVGVGLTFDYRDSLVGEDPDIGAYEYNPDDYDPPPTAPSVTTTNTIIYTRLARAGGTSLDAGGGTISAKGICWSTSANPTTSDSKLACGTGTDAFSGYIPNLKANTTYHVRAYATNATATSYGADIEFTTPVHSVTKIGNKYPKTQIKTVIHH